MGAVAAADADSFIHPDGFLPQGTTENGLQARGSANGSWWRRKGDGRIDAHWRCRG